MQQKDLAMFKTMRKLYRLSYDKLIVFSIADCQGEELFKRTTCFNRNFSWLFDRARKHSEALPESPENLRLEILVCEKFTELISTNKITFLLTKKNPVRDIPIKHVIFC